MLMVSVESWGKVDPPNYDFSLDKFNNFMPGKSFSAASKDYPNKKLTFTTGQFKTYKIYIEHIRYRFPILVQIKGDEITDFHARLPAYFLHDIFHQSLINRYGGQDIYKKVEDQAVYIWKNENGLKHSYNGVCSITCFPVFYAVEKNNHAFGSGYKSLIETFGKD